MQCLECDKPSSYAICEICEFIEELGNMLDNGCKTADKVQTAYDNAIKMRDTRPNH